MKRVLKTVLCVSMLPLFAFADGSMHENKENKADDHCCADRTMLSADFLFWRADTNDAELAIQATVTTTSTGNSVNKNVLPLNGKWEPGYRLAFEYEFGDFDQWNFALTYTYFRGDSVHKSVNTGTITTKFLRQDWSTFLGPIDSSASGKWNVNLNVADIEIGRQYKITPKIAVRPHGGVRLAWLNYHYNANYDGVWYINSAQKTASTSMKAKSDFNAGGLEGGTQLHWNFFKNLGLIADVNVSLLYGHFDVNEKFAGADTSTGSLVPVTERYKESMNGVRTNLDILLGLQGGIFCCKDKVHLFLFAGYELSEWFRANELFKVNRSFDLQDNEMFSLDHVSNDISFQGLTVRAGISF